MQDYRLTPQELGELRAAHRRVRDAREAYRLNAVILLGTGWRVRDIAEALLIDPDTVRSHFQRFREGGITALLHMNYVGSEAWLDAQQLQELDQHLRSTLYLTAAEVAGYVEERWRVCYTLSGMTALLHRLGYIYKIATLEPGKHPAPEVQQAFVEKYEKLKADKGQDDVIYFVDAVHPQHNPILGYGWIKRGQEQTLPSNTGRQRLNINGAINIAALSAEVRFDDTINATSTIALFQQLEAANPTADRILVIGDNARYYKAKLVSAYLENSRIEFVSLPPYCPNLNLIERLWKFLKRQVLHNQYYETFKKFKDACKRFFAEFDRFAPQLRTLLTENFQIIGK
jgi:transposase